MMKLNMPYAIYNAAGVNELGAVERTKVYEGTIEVSHSLDMHAEYMRALEDLFEMFNIRHPHDYRGRSMSTGDVVVLGETAYLCAPVGWELYPHTDTLKG